LAGGGAGPACRPGPFHAPPAGGRQPGAGLDPGRPGDFQDWLRAALAEGWWRAVSTAALRRHDKEDEP
jgi:hypothetical protein